MTKPWLLEDALNLIRVLQEPSRQHGYHLALGGGVLNKGYSEKDLDLYFLPMESDKGPKTNPDSLVGWLTELWGTPVPIQSSGDSSDVQNEPFIKSPPQFGSGNRNFLSYPGIYPRFSMPKQIVYNRSAYTYKLKWTRSSGDRIDVFIMGGSK